MTISFIHYCCNNHCDEMEHIGPHTYFLGQPMIKTLKTEEANTLNKSSTEKIVTYTKLLKDGIIYCTSSKLDRKRNSSFCSFRCACNGEIQFGRILLFVKTSPPKVLLYKMEVTSVLKNAGPPCRGRLEMYKEVDILTEHRFMLNRQREHEQFISVPINSIISKAMKIDIDRTHSYIIRQPNN